MKRKLNHQFGYGTDNQKINKITLKNKEHLNLYLNDVLQNAFIAKIKDNVLQFDNGETIKITIK